MPETKGAKKVMKKMQDQYGKKAGERVYYATANKQGRSKANFKKECMEGFFKSPELTRVVNNTLLSRIDKKISRLHEALPYSQPQSNKVKVIMVLRHPDEVSGISILSDGTRIYWTEGRSSTSTITYPDGRKEVIPVSRPHPILDKLNEIGAYDKIRDMTSEEEAEYESIKENKLNRIGKKVSRLHEADMTGAAGGDAVGWDVSYTLRLPDGAYITLFVGPARQAVLQAVTQGRDVDELISQPPGVTLPVGATPVDQPVNAAQLQHLVDKFGIEFDVQGWVQPGNPTENFFKAPELTEALNNADPYMIGARLVYDIVINGNQQAMQNLKLLARQHGFDQQPLLQDIYDLWGQDEHENYEKMMLWLDENSPSLGITQNPADNPV